MYLDKVIVAKRRESQLQRIMLRVQQGPSWEVRKRQLSDSELVQITSEGVSIIQQRLKTAISR